MPRRRKKKIARPIYPSASLLPERLAPRYADVLQVFCDASRQHHGGLAAVFFESPDSEALIKTRSVDAIGSNELELQAALFALEQARLLFPGRSLALFSDNQDAVNRLQRSITQGLAQDPALQQLLAAQGLSEGLAHVAVGWIKGHARCRGNILADQHAAQAASGLLCQCRTGESAGFVPLARREPQQ